MSKVKRILSVIMAMVMVLAMSVPTFAAGQTATINLSGDTLTANTTIKYVQIVEPDTTSTLGWKFSDDAYAQAFMNAFSVETADAAIGKLIELGLDNNATNGTINVSTQLGVALKALETSATKTDNITTDTNSVPKAITGLTKAGLYLVTANTTGYAYIPMLAYIKDAGLGNLVDANLTVKGSKNQVVKVIDNEDDQSVSAGDKIEYTVTAEYPYYSANEDHKTFTATDTLTNATFDETSLTITVEGVANPLADPADYTANLINDNKTLNIDFKYNPAYAGKIVTFKYTAIAGAGEGNVSNRVKTNFDTAGDSVSSAKVTVAVEKLAKDNSKLPNAEFTLFEYSEEEKEDYTKVENASVIEKGTAATKTIWVKKVGNQQLTGSDGTTTFVGLDAQKKYCIQETNAPTGYKIQKDYHVLTGAEKISAETSKEYQFSNFDKITVTDENLSALPSTGGIGTTIFTIGGCAIMIVAAGLFFATRRKTQK